MLKMASADWAISSFDTLTAERLGQIDAINPDVCIVGIGQRQRFIHSCLIKVQTAHQVAPAA